MKNKSPIIGIVTGMPNSFTTIISQLLMSNSKIASGVECGILLSEIKDFNKIQPFWDWLISKEKWGWCLNKVDRQKLLKAKSYLNAYEILNEIKGRENPDYYLRDLFKNSDFIFDKTPAYIFKLYQIMDKVDIPVLITLKTWEEGLSGLIKRQRKSYLNILSYFRSYNLALDQVLKSLNKYPERILIIYYKQFCSKTIKTMNMVAKHFDIEMEDEYSLDNYNIRFGNKIESKNSFKKNKIIYQSMPIKISIIKKIFIYFLGIYIKIKFKKLKKLAKKNNFEF